MKNLSYFDKTRISNIVWTITEKYGYNVDFSLIKEDYFDYDIVYNSAIIGSLYNILDYKMILDFVNLLKEKINKSIEIMSIFFMCVESCCITKNTEYIKNIDNLRKQNYKKNIEKLKFGIDKDKLYNQLRLGYYNNYLGMPILYNQYIKNIIFETKKFEQVQDTLEFIENFKKIIDDYFKFEEALISEKKEETASHTKLQRISILHNNTQTIKEFFDNYTSAEFSPNESIIEKNFSTDASTVDEKEDKLSYEESFLKMESYYGKSIFPTKIIKEIEKKHCVGIHKGYRLFFTDGSISSISEKYRKEQIKNDYEKNKSEYEKNKLIYDRYVEKIKSLIKSSMKFEEKLKNRSYSGIVNANKIYRAEKVNDYKIFIKEKRRDEVKFLVDIVVDSSASLLQKQEKLSLQAYTISRALEDLQIKNSVKTFNNFMDYTIIKILKDYDDTNCDNCFRYFCSGGNRDGLAIDVIGNMSAQFSDYKKLTILFTDAKPYDVQVLHAIGIKGKKPYQGDDAIDDTASSIRKLRQKGVKLCGIFSGELEDVFILRHIYGSDFLYIQDVDQFANKVGKFISDYISNFYE